MVRRHFGVWPDLKRAIAESANKRHSIIVNILYYYIIFIFIDLLIRFY